MRHAALFIIVVGCSGAPVTPPRPQPQRAPGDASVAVPPPLGPVVTPALGAACSQETGCADGLTCMPMPGGYCTSPCGVIGSACAGSCVENPRAGELCLAKCTSDADCRAAEGYACDPLWIACMMPNSGTIVPRACPALGGYGRNPAFAPSVALSTSV